MSLYQGEVGDIKVLKESFTTPLTKITNREIKLDLTEANFSQRQTKDEFDHEAYKLMMEACYNFEAYVEGHII